MISYYDKYTKVTLLDTLYPSKGFGPSSIFRTALMLMTEIQQCAENIPQRIWFILLKQSHTVQICQLHIHEEK